MSIHSEHPFWPPADERDPVRRMRARLPAPVTVWATGAGEGRRGLTVSSVLLADGRPAKVAGLIDEDSDFWDTAPREFVVNVLAAEHRFLAEAFAGAAPAPGGPFTLGQWGDTEWGPVLAESAGWIGVRRDAAGPEHLGWGLLVTGVVEHVEPGDVEALIHLRGRYRA